MRQSYLAISLISSLSALTSPLVMASPNTVEIGITCPNASGIGYNSLSNFGGRIVGYGTETINDNPSPHSPYFSYEYTTGHFPTNIANGAYENNGIDYDPTNALVVCKFSSTSGFDPISVSYQLTNGHGGIVLKQTSNSILFMQYLGLKN